MSSKFFFFFLFAGAIALTIFGLNLSRVKKTSQVLGCPILTHDGLVDPKDTVAFWQDATLSPPLALVDSLSDSQKKVLGASTGEKWIEVDLTNQKLIAHQGSQIILESLISSGLWNGTPVGEYRIWYKIRSTKMEGGSRENNTYYYLPNVPYAIFFYGNYGIHGTYWHANFGHPMSHGCVNAPTPVAEKLFYWADPQLPEGQFVVRSTATNPGTRVVIHY